MPNLINVIGDTKKLDCVLNFDEFKVTWSNVYISKSEDYKLSINIINKDLSTKKYTRYLSLKLWELVLKFKKEKVFIEIFSKAFAKAPYQSAIPKFEEYSYNDLDVIFENIDNFEPNIVIVYPFMSKNGSNSSSFPVYEIFYNLYIKHKLKFEDFTYFRFNFLSSIRSINNYEENFEKLHIINFLLNNNLNKNLTLIEYLKNKEQYELDFNRIYFDNNSAKFGYVKELTNEIVSFRDINFLFEKLVNTLHDNLEILENSNLRFRDFNKILQFINNYSEKDWGKFSNFLRVLKFREDYHNTLNYFDFLKDISKTLEDKTLIKKYEELIVSNPRREFELSSLVRFLFNYLDDSDKTFKILIELSKNIEIKPYQLLWVLDNFKNPTELPLKITSVLAEKN